MKQEMTPITNKAEPKNLKNLLAFDDLFFFDLAMYVTSIPDLLRIDFLSADGYAGIIELMFVDTYSYYNIVCGKIQAIL